MAQGRQVPGELEVDGISKRYGEVVALDGMTFDVRAGELFGFVGGNGAGKTTTMRMVMGVLAPTAGTVLWQGRPVTAADRSRFGYMPEERGLYPKQPVLAQLTYLGQLHGMTATAARARSTELLEALGSNTWTDGRADRLIETLGRSIGRATPGEEQARTFELGRAFFVAGFTCTRGCDPSRYNPLRVTTTVALDLGFFQLRWYSLAYLAGIVLGYWHLSRMIKAPGAPMAQRLLAAGHELYVRTRSRVPSGT